MLNMNRKLSFKPLFVCLVMLLGQKVSATGYSDANDNLPLPFKTAVMEGEEIADATQWYKIQVSGGKYWAVEDGALVCSAVSGSFTDANYFCFAGDNVNGFHIFNRSLGASYVICCASDTSHEPLLPVPRSSAPSPSTLKVSRNGDGYNFYYPGNQTACVNDLHNDGVLTLWTSSAAPSGVGCRMYIEEVDVQSLLPVQEDGVPFRCTRVVNGEFAPGTRWYSMDIRSGKLIRATDTGLLCAPADTLSRSHLWCFTGNKAEGFTAYSYAYGTGYAAHASSADNGTTIAMEPLDSQKAGSFTFMLSQNENGGINLHYPGIARSCWNDFGNEGRIALWNSQNAPDDPGSSIQVSECDPASLPQEHADDSTAWMPVRGEIVYLCMSDGGVNAFPKEYMLTQTVKDGHITILAKNGETFAYDEESVDSITTKTPAKLPEMLSFKFNNKFNDMLMVDAQGEFADPSHISVSVGSIGKRLVASIKTSADEAEIYVADSLQESKRTSRRFDSPVTYTVALPGWRMLRRNAVTGKYGMHPFGNDYQVTVRYLCDTPTSDYGVPVMRITTDDGTMISSKSTYWNAKVSIDGAGYFPDMEETPIQIKGRGNSSWAGAWGKSPYRIKFSSKQKPLGMKAGKNWNLIANALRGSMTTNVIGSRVAGMVGAAAANHFLPVELYINGNYRGSYTLTEKVGMGNNSIDLPDETNAVLLELDTYYDETYKFKTTRYSIPVNVKYPDFSSDETNLTLSSISKHFNTLTNALQRMRPIEETADPVYLARFLMVNDLVFNLELYHPKSLYVYHENILSDTARYVFGPVWDFDWGFGYETAGNYFRSNAETDFYSTTEAASTGRAFLRALRYNGGEELNRQYYRVWTDFVHNHLDDLLEYLDDYYAVAARSFEHDNMLWSSGGSDDYAAITARSKEWIRKRAHYVLDYLSNTLGYAGMGYLEPDVPDAVDLVQSGKTPQPVPGVYDLQGRSVGGSIDNLPSGVYIQDGRKVIKR